MLHDSQLGRFYILDWQETLLVESWEEKMNNCVKRYLVLFVKKSKVHNCVPKNFGGEVNYDSQGAIKQESSDR